jgi:proteasome alpha subunit
VAEVGDDASGDQIYRLTYDGSVADVQGFAVMGGQAEQVETHLGEHYTEGLDLTAALRLAVQSLAQDTTPARTIPAADLEVATLDRTRPQPRKFKRFTDEAVAAALG